MQNLQFLSIFQVLIQQQQTQMEETVATAQNDMIQRLATETNISLSEFDDVLRPIIESCTKDSISTGYKS